MERQLREIEDEKNRKEREETAKGGWTGSESKNRNEDEDEEMVVIKSEFDESLPLAKPGYNIGGGFVPIQVRLIYTRAFPILLRKMS